MKGIIVFFTLIFIPLLSFPQNQEINGVIVAFNKFSLKNVLVKAKKAKTETLTNDLGIFNINVKKNDILIIEADGFANYRYKVKSTDKSLKINLIYEDKKKNKENVLNAEYIHKDDLEYGLEFLAAENSVFSNFTDVYDAISYALPASSIIFENGEKKIQIRGAKTLTGSNAALIVLDGMIVDDISFIVTSEIVSISHLTGPPAAIYGTRGANGVISIITK